MRTNIPESLLKKQEAQRENTMKVVEEAIKEIKLEGGVVTKKKLQELTGLSSATFSKEHVLYVLKQYKVCQFKDVKTVKKDSTGVDMKEYRLLKRISYLENEINKRDKKIESLSKQIKELTFENEKLLGELYKHFTGVSE